LHLGSLNSIRKWESFISATARFSIGLRIWPYRNIPKRINIEPDVTRPTIIHSSVFCVI